MQNMSTQLNKKKKKKENKKSTDCEFTPIWATVAKKRKKKRLNTNDVCLTKSKDDF